MTRSRWLRWYLLAASPVVLALASLVAVGPVAKARTARALAAVGVTFSAAHVELRFLNLDDDDNTMPPSSLDFRDVTMEAAAWPGARIHAKRMFVAFEDGRFRKLRSANIFGAQIELTGPVADGVSQLQTLRDGLLYLDGRGASFGVVVYDATLAWKDSLSAGTTISASGFGFVALGARAGAPLTSSGEGNLTVATPTASHGPYRVEVSNVRGDDASIELRLPQVGAVAAWGRDVPVSFLAKEPAGVALMEGPAGAGISALLSLSIGTTLPAHPKVTPE